MKKNVFILIIISISFILFLFIAISNEGNKSDKNYDENLLKSITFETVEMGQFSHYPTVKEKLIIIQNDQEWQELLNMHYSHQIPKKELPAIDFNKETVIAVFLGPSGGADRIKIASVQINDKQGKLYVHAIKEVAHPKCHVIAVVTNPFHIIKIKSKTTGMEHFFKLNIQTIDCK